MTEEIVQPTPPLLDAVDVVFLPQYVQEADETFKKRVASKRNASIKRLKRLRYFMKFFRKTDVRIAEKVKGMRASENLHLFFLRHRRAVVICFGIRYFSEAYYGSLGCGCKRIFAEVISPQWKYQNDAEGLEHTRFLISRSDAVIYQTYDILDFYGKRLCKNEYVVRNPIKQLPPPYEGARTHTIVNFCRINGQKDNQKNLMMTVKAFHGFLQAYPDYRLKLYGYVPADDPKDDFKCQIERLGMDQNVELLPPDVRVHEKILDSAMFVSTSNFEGLSNTMLEAMAIGLPCICTDCLAGARGRSSATERMAC